MSWFDRIARTVENAVGTPAAFMAAMLTIIIWAATGPIFYWSDTWQLVINTGTTIITFLMAFLIQATQTRDNTAIHLKLDELIRVSVGARTELMEAEEMGKRELAKAVDQIRHGYD